MGLTFGQMDMPLMWTATEPHDHRFSQPEAPFQALWSHSKPATSNATLGLARVSLTDLDYARGWCGPGLARAVPKPELPRLKAEM